MVSTVAQLGLHGVMVKIAASRCMETGRLLGKQAS